MKGPFPPCEFDRFEELSRVPCHSPSYQSGLYHLRLRGIGRSIGGFSRPDLPVRRDSNRFEVLEESMTTLRAMKIHHIPEAILETR